MSFLKHWAYTCNGDGRAYVVCKEQEYWAIQEKVNSIR